MNKEEITTKLENVFLMHGVDTIFPNRKFVEDMGLTEDDFIDISIYLEKHFDLEVTAEEIKGSKTFGDLVDYVYKKISEGQKSK